MVICDMWEIGQRFSDGSSLKNQHFRDNRRWKIGLLICDIWEIGQGFIYGSSLNNQKFRDHRGRDFVIDGILVEGDSNQKNF